MNDKYLMMLSELIEFVELVSEKELTEQNIDYLRGVLQITYHDGDRNGSERMRKIIEGARK